MRRLTSISLVIAALFASQAIAADDLTPLSDEFNDTSSLSRWTWLHDVEQWPNRIQSAEIADGYLTVIPWTTSWFNDLIGPHLYKRVEGNFVLHTRVRGRGKNGRVPTSLYSLTGPFIRQPLTRTRATWVAGQENYNFLSTGTGNDPASIGNPTNTGTKQLEVKTTVDSSSTLAITNLGAGVDEVELQIVRIGRYIIALRQAPGDSTSGWVVHARYDRPDYNATINVGVTFYTDWNLIDPRFFPNNVTGYNNNFILPQDYPTANPDLVARYDHIRFCRPVIPLALQGLNFFSSASVNDAQILSFLGANAPCSTEQSAASSSSSTGPASSSSSSSTGGLPNSATSLTLSAMALVITVTSSLLLLLASPSV